MCLYLHLIKFIPTSRENMIKLLIIVNYYLSCFHRCFTFTLNEPLNLKVVALKLELNLCDCVVECTFLQNRRKYVGSWLPIRFEVRSNDETVIIYCKFMHSSDMTLLRVVHYSWIIMKVDKIPTETYGR